MKTFYVGQRVKVYNPQRSQYHNREGRVEETDRGTERNNLAINRNIRVRFGQSEAQWFDDVELEPFEEDTQSKETVMSQKLSRYLQLAHDPIGWEEVDEYTWENYEQALGPDGQKARYTGNMVLTEGDKIMIHGEDLTARDMCVIMRFAGVKGNEAPQSLTGGFVRSQDFLRFRKGKKEWIHETNGDNHYKRTKATEASSEDEEKAKKLGTELKV
jgi:hypothetical protein